MRLSQQCQVVRVDRHDPPGFLFWWNYISASVKPINALMMGYVVTRRKTVRNPAGPGNATFQDIVPSTYLVTKARYTGMISAVVRTWSEQGVTIPSGNDNVVVCRRVPGSGTQASYNWYLNNFGCGGAALPPAQMSDSDFYNDSDEDGFPDDCWNGSAVVACSTLVNPGAASDKAYVLGPTGYTVIENSASGNVRDCLTKAANGGLHTFGIAAWVACTLLGGTVGVALGAAEQAPPAAAGQAAEAEPLPLFDIWEYQVKGNTVLSNLAIEKAVYPYLGPQRSIEDVQKAKQSLEKAYHDAGYLTVFVDIPEQTVDTGVVELKVTEGKIDKVVVSGNRYYSRGGIRAKAPEITPGTVPHFPQMQKELAATSRPPDRTVTPILRPAKTPGAVEVELKVDDKLPLHGEIDLNNRYSANTKPLRLNALLRYDNLWQRDHSIALGYLVAPQDPSESQVVYGTYVIPLHDSRALAFYAVNSRSNVAAVSALTVLGQGTLFGTRYITPVPSYKSLSSSVTLGVDYKDFEDTVGFTDTGGTATPVTYLPFVASWDGNLVSERVLNQFNLGVEFSIRGLGNDPDEFEAKCFGCTPNFAILKGGWRRTQRFGNDLVLYTRLQGQYTEQTLISNEDYAIGGVDTVRGYVEAAAQGDQGASGTIELRSPSLAGRVWKGLADLRAFVFLDAGYTHVLDPLPGQIADFRLMGAGVGLMARANNGLAAFVDYAFPFDSVGVADSSEAQFNFSVAYAF